MHSKCFIYSTEDDKLFVRHLQKVLKYETNVKIMYAIGRDKNCETDEICSCDQHSSKAIFIRSYSHVPTYVKIPDTFYWVHPKFRATNYENKLFATDSKLSGEEMSQFLSSIIPPRFICDFSSLSSLRETKNYAPCESRVSLCLK